MTSTLREKLIEPAGETPEQWQLAHLGAVSLRVFLEEVTPTWSLLSPREGMQVDTQAGRQCVQHRKGEWH